MDNYREIGFYSDAPPPGVESAASATPQPRAITDADRQAIIAFVTRNPNLDDRTFHAFAEKRGISPSDAERVVYKLAFDLSQKVRGVSAQAQKLAQAKKQAQTSAALKGRHQQESKIFLYMAIALGALGFIALVTK